jgi:hypothetical protein
MKDLNLGDILENGSRVDSVMQIDNTNYKEALYKIPNGVDGNAVYVTGSHYIFHNNKYIQVIHYPLAVKQNSVKSDYYSCIITNDHTIQLGSNTFFDYEDWRLFV